jgi:hypothetical protein
MDNLTSDLTDVWGSSGGDGGALTDLANANTDTSTGTSGGSGFSFSSLLSGLTGAVQAATPLANTAAQVYGTVKQAKSKNNAAAAAANAQAAASNAKTSFLSTLAKYSPWLIGGFAVLLLAGLAIKIFRRK